jgi:hypothetical protein
VLDHEQGSRLMVELFTDVLADFVSLLAAFGASTLLGHIMMRMRGRLSGKRRRPCPFFGVVAVVVLTGAAVCSVAAAVGATLDNSRKSQGWFGSARCPAAP